MKVTLIHVLSLDAKLTRGTKNNIYEWSSKEDFETFQREREKHNLIVMGSGTFDGVKDNPQAGLKAEPERLRIVLTSRPEAYQTYIVPGQLEFSNETPTQLIERLEKNGYNKMLLVSGGKVATSFFKEKRINELLITIEPQIFGIGEPFVQPEPLDISLQLIAMKQVNKKGTVLLQYNVV